MAKIGFDFDEMYTESHSLKSALAKELFGIEIPPARFERKWVVPEFLSPEQYDQVGKKVFEEKRQLQFISGAVDYTKLIQRNHSVEIVTSRSGEALCFAQKLLAEQGLVLKMTGVGYRKSKLEPCRGLKLYADDDVSKLTPLIGFVPHLLLFSRPQNTEDEVPKGVVRVPDWHGVYDYIWHEVR